jgi:uncharacterized membrane protein YhaH (DUF805 family)
MCSFFIGFIFVLANLSQSFAIVTFVSYTTLIILIIAFLIPLFAIYVRRLHDIGQPGWWVLLNFVGLNIIPFVMTLLDSQPGYNKYGPNPN